MGYPLTKRSYANANLWPVCPEPVAFGTAKRWWVKIERERERGRVEKSAHSHSSLIQFMTDRHNFHFTSSMVLYFAYIMFHSIFTVLAVYLLQDGTLLSRPSRHLHRMHIFHIVWCNYLMDIRRMHGSGDRTHANNNPHVAFHSVTLHTHTQTSHHITSHATFHSMIVNYSYCIFCCCCLIEFKEQLVFFLYIFLFSYAVRYANVRHINIYVWCAGNKCIAHAASYIGTTAFRWSSI